MQGTQNSQNNLEQEQSWRTGWVLQEADLEI